ncbi:hypothetical protein [Citrobacter amalonaticus]
MALGGMILAFSVGAHALKPQNIDPRDPSIWQEKPDASPAQSNSPCEVFSSSACPGREDEKSDIQRERERREHQRFQHEYERHTKRD